MDTREQLETCCNSLESHKITIRKQGSDQLDQLLRQKATTEFLNEQIDWWKRILTSIQFSLGKDHEKQIDDNRKKGTAFSTPPSADLFALFVRIAAKENASLSYQKLFICILENLSDKSKVYLHNTFLTILSASFLTSSYIRSILKSSDWESLYRILKSLCGSKPNCDTEQLKCLAVVIKWGPLGTFPVSLFRVEFNFIQKLCKKVTPSSAQVQQEVFLELVFDFYKHAAKDNRMACCKLGEKMFFNLVEFYQNNARDNEMKANLVEFFLLLVSLHHPKGVKGSHQASYAFSRDLWEKCLLKMYDLLTTEIDTNPKSAVKNQSFFIAKNTDRLFDGFVCLFVEVCQQLLNQSVVTEEPPKKRPRVEFSISNLIEKIKGSRSWTWINVICRLLDTYPDVITGDEYLTLLKTLISLQNDTKDPTLLFHIYNALLVLQKIDKVALQSDDLWKSLADSTLRSMNQNDELHTLLQQLIVGKYITSHEGLFQWYKPGVASTITEYNLKTLEVAFKNLTYLQFDNNLKREVISWILSNNSKLFCHSYVAEILFCLILKQWSNNSPEFVAKKRQFEDIEDIYLSISFENLLICDESVTRNEDNQVFCVDESVFKYLVEILMNLTNNFDVSNQIDDLLNVTVLLFNVISFLIKFGIVEIEKLDDFNLHTFFEMCAVNLFSNLPIKNDEINLNKTIEYLQTLHVLFSSQISEFMTKHLRELVPEKLIKEMFSGLQNECEDMSQSCFVSFRKGLIETLVSFSCLPDCNSLLVNQKRALEVLLESDYDCSSDSDYVLVMTILRSLKLCQPKNISEESLLSIFNLFQSVCEVRYYCYVSAVEIVDLFYDIYPLVALSDSVPCKTQFVGILYPFYSKRLDYGPEISIGLLKSMALLFELESFCVYSRWSNEEIVLKIPEFLTNDYQEVRFAAIQAIGKVFQISTKTRLLEQYHRQEIMFSKITEMSHGVLQIEGQVNEERQIDETVTRTASILHTFASIMVASHLWVEEALFTVLKIVCDKNLGLAQVGTVIEMVAKKLGFESGLKFLEKNLVPLVNRWKVYDFETFPFVLFECDSKSRFYTKYWDLIAHIFVENEENSLNQIASNVGATLQKLIEGICPKLLSRCIGDEVSDLTSIRNNKIYRLLIDTLGMDKSRQLFKSNIEETVLCLTEFISDETSFKTSFGKSIIFPKSCENRMTVDNFHDCLQFIESTLYDDNSVITHLMQNNPEKIHFILLQLKLRINTALSLEEKLRYFHLYSIMTSLCVDNMAQEPSLQTYLIRDLTHNLLHLIKNYKNHLELSEISCRYFKTIIQKILPDFAKVLSEFFLVIISRLKNIALENCPISDSCIGMLQFLIVDHQNFFLSEIEKLDSIPRTPQFEKIYSVHFSIKYNNRKVTLQDEITQFLDFAKSIESLDECEQSLTHLRTLLTERKDELKTLYTELRETRGFSEDCENSNLHKLICMLITLSCSSNKRVMTEAMRCLGEIGPSDLATLILQPEKGIPEAKWTPWELVLGYAVSLLSKYIVDSDVRVIKVASVALFQVFSTKAGRKVAESETDFGFGATKCNYLNPFCAIPLRGSNFVINVKGDFFMDNIRSDDLWIPGYSCHKTWIMKLVCTLLETFQESEFCSSFIKVCKMKIEFCEQILPLVVYTILYLNISTVTNLISAQIKSFFDKHWDITVNNHTVTSITTNKSSVQSMLNVIHFVRLQRSVRKKEIKKLTLNYLKVAKAAHFCTAHFTALLYADMWCQEQINEWNECALSTCTYTKLDLVYEKVDDVTGNALQNILRQAYKAVGEVDALLGCGTSHLLNPASRVDHYKELGRWDQVTHHYELEVSLGGDSLRPLVDSLKRANLYQLSLFCSNALDEPNYESLWRLGQWDYNKRSKSDLCHSYDKCTFYALKALNDNDEFSFCRSLDEGRNCVVKDFVGANMESIKNFYATFTKLQCLKEVEDFAEALKDGKVVECLIKWKRQDDIILNDYQYVEPVQAQRIVLLGDFLKKAQSQRGDLGEAIMDTILDYAEFARTEGNSNVAFRILENLRLLPSAIDIAAKIQFEEAQLCWSIQDVLTAKCLLRQLCNDNVNPRLHAMALKMTGKWMVESSSENRQTIIENYFQKSLALLKKNTQKTKEDERSVLDTFDQLAKFADHEYQAVMSHIKSDIFQKKKKNVIKTKRTISGIDVKRATKDLKKAIAIKERQSCIDAIEINNMETDKNNLLQLALRYYLLNLIGSDDHHMTIFRLISLLLENRNNEIVKPVLEKDLLKIPTYKFVNILPQIIPHISSSGDLFSQTVNNVIEKCAKEHPYHTLPLILSLALSNKDRDYAESKAVVNDARMQSARSILDKLEGEENLRSLIEKMEFVSEAVIELAYLKNDGDDDGKFKVPRKCKIRKIQNYDDVLVPTYNLPVRKSGDYGRVIGISSFSDAYHNVGGINAPKRITCTGTDGVVRSQLIKGQDDLRQDAVMQQVFTIMNSLLNVNKQTKNLLIRTYKIVPLSMRSGILEWVENTMPIGEYLTGEGNGGAHVKFRPTDMNPLKCRAEFKRSASIKSNEEKLKIFNGICLKIKPVFHKFFETTFPQPTVWYERRRAFIHSVATSSMCGYILGIGDRHVNNILIDKSTAEVVHIDFGIAFEQGRVLPTPETVPFRLTRDIVDGMGVSGVEGVFRRACEKTVEVLRRHNQTIITILEVLLYDPLYDWTVSSAEAIKRQKDEQDDSYLPESVNGSGEESPTQDVNVTAERALLKLRAKLQGTERGKSTTVERQVGTLIQQAVDPSNLSRLFHGWQPYL